MRSSTRLRVSGPTSVHARTTFETVITDTSRSRAMSFRRTGDLVGVGTVFNQKASITTCARRGGVRLKSEQVWKACAKRMNPCVRVRSALRRENSGLHFYVVHPQGGPLHALP